MDPTWEFQAPQFVDFNTLGEDEDPTVDHFFNVDMENGELWVTAVSSHEAMNEDVIGGNYQINTVEVGNDQTIPVSTVDQVDGPRTLSQVKSSFDPSKTSQVVNNEGMPSSSIFKDSGSRPMSKSSRGMPKTLGIRTNHIGSSTPKRLGTKSQDPRLLVPRPRSQIHRSLNTPTASRNKSRSPVALVNFPGVVIGKKCLKYKLSDSHLNLMQAKENKQPKFISQAEQILKYQNSTPSRFRSRVAPRPNDRHRLASVPQGSKSSLRKASVVEMLVESSLKSGTNHGSQVQTKSAVTIPEPFRFNTLHRAGEREQFERKKRRKEASAEEERELESMRKEKELDDKLIEARKTLVHKAQPVRNYKPLQIKRSDKRVTQPVSPHLGVPKGANCSR